MIKVDPRLNFESFISHYKEFQLGDLVTEQVHPLTVDLSDLAKSDLTKALKVLKEVDSEALQVLPNQIKAISELSLQISEVISKGGRIFLCGCKNVAGNKASLHLLLSFG